MRFTILFASIMLFLPQLCLCETTSPLSEDRKIQMLIKAIEKSDLTFERNGTDYPAVEAAKHLDDKRKHAGTRITTAKDFIDKVASRSSLSGKEYHVKSKDGKRVPAETWLKGELTRIEGKDRITSGTGAADTRPSQRLTTTP